MISDSGLRIQKILKLSSYCVYLSRCNLKRVRINTLQYYVTELKITWDFEDNFEKIFLM